MCRFWVFLLFPVSQLLSLCKCDLEIGGGLPYKIANQTLIEAQQLGLGVPHQLACFGCYSPLNNCCETYSAYRSRFHLFMDFLEEDSAKSLKYIREDIEEINKKLAVWKMYPSCYVLKEIAWYEQILKQKTEYLAARIRNLPMIRSILADGLAKITDVCEQIYTFCIENHRNATSFYERGFIYYNQGKYFESINDGSKALEISKGSYQDTDYYLMGGEAYSQVGLYGEAIEALNKALARDPMNKKALFERAVAYFETGNFEQSIEDFLLSGIHSKPLDASLLDFGEGFISGAKEGLKEFGIEFFPSLLSTARGLGSAIWVYGVDHFGFKLSEDMYNACQQFVQFVKTHSLSETVEAVSPRLKALIYDLDSLSLKQRGEYLGYLIAKNGIEIVASVGAAKAYQKMRKANAVLTLEALSSPAKKTEIVEKATKWGEKHSAEIQKMRNNEAYIQSLRGQKFSESTIRKTLHELGYKTFPRPKGLPDHFIAEFSKKNGGIVYFHPKNRNISVRIMPGEPKSPNPWQRKPYVRRVYEGDCVDKYGNKYDSKGIKYTKDRQEVHIPFEEFEFIEIDKT